MPPSIEKVKAKAKDKREIIRGVTKKKKNKNKVSLDKKFGRLAVQAIFQMCRGVRTKFYSFVCCICRFRKKQVALPVLYQPERHLGLRSLEDPNCKTTCNTCHVGIYLKNPIEVKTMLPIKSHDKIHSGLLATKDYKKGDVLCEYEGKKVDRFGKEKDAIKDKSKTCGIGFEVVDGMNSQSRGPRMNTGVVGVPFMSNNVVKMKHTTKGAPVTTKNGRKKIPFFAGDDIKTGNELFYDYGPGYGGYQNDVLFKRKHIIAAEDKIYFRECNAAEFQQQFAEMKEKHELARLRLAQIRSKPRRKRRHYQ